MLECIPIDVQVEVPCHQDSLYAFAPVPTEAIHEGVIQSRSEHVISLEERQVTHVEIRIVEERNVTGGILVAVVGGLVVLPQTQEEMHVAMHWAVCVSGCVATAPVLQPPAEGAGPEVEGHMVSLWVLLSSGDTHTQGEKQEE